MLDALRVILARRRYRTADASLVLARGLGDVPLPARHGSGYVMNDVTLHAWIATFGRWHAVADAEPVNRVEVDGSEHIHEAIVASIRVERLHAVLADDGRIVACGLGVLDGELFGLFDLVTARAERRRGHGAALVHHMLVWAQARRAAYAYLQVARANLAARHVYARLAFRPLYRYEYRIARAT